MDEELFREPFPETWLAFLRSNVFPFQRLNEAEQTRLQLDVQTLIGEKIWEGCGGLSVTDEMKVTVAGQACLLLLGREHDCFSRVHSILLYPSGFRRIE